MCSLALAQSRISVAGAAAPPMDVLMVFGFMAMVLTLLSWQHAHLYKSRAALMVLAVDLLGLAVYAFLQGAWPLGILTMCGAAFMLRQWRAKRNCGAWRNPWTGRTADHPPQYWNAESRINRMF